jgi:hypothetical protein
MKRLIQYQLKNSSKEIIGIFLVFLIIEALLLLNLQTFYVLPMSESAQEVMSFVIAVMAFGITMLLLFIQVIISFYRLLQSYLVRMTPMKGIYYILSTLIVWFILAATMILFGLLLLHLYGGTIESEQELAVGIQKIISINAGTLTTMLITGAIDSSFNVALLSFIITIVLSLGISKKIQGIIGVISYFILGGMVSWIITKLTDLPYKFTLFNGFQISQSETKLEFTMKPFEVSMFAYGFTFVLTFILIYTAAYFIDRKTEL